MTGLSDGPAASRHDRRRGHGPGRPRRRRDVGLLGLAAPPLAAVRAGLRLRPRVRPADAGPARVDRLGAAPGPERRQQPVPLLPADRRRPDPVGRLRRDPPLRQPGRAGARRPAADLRPARGAVLPGVPAARRARVPVSLGRRDRHDLAVHGHVRPDDGRPGDVRPRLHRPGRRGQPLGGRRRARLHPATRRGPPAAAPRDARRRSRSRPSRCARSPSRPSATSWTGPTATRAAAGVLLKTLDALGIGFDS